MELPSMEVLQAVSSASVTDSKQDRNVFATSKDAIRPGNIAYQAMTRDIISSNTDDCEIDNLTSALSLPQSQSDMESAPLNIETTPKNCREFDVLLPLTTLVRNMYSEFLQKSQEKLNSIETIASLSSNQLANLDLTLDNIRKFCDYPSLEFIDHFKQREYNQLYRAKYAENISTKIIFTIEFLGQIKSHTKSIVIIIRQELFDVFDAIFQEQKITYCRADRPDVLYGNTETSEIRVTLVLTPNEISNIKHADVVIALDSNYFQNYDGKGARFINSSTIFLHLIIYHSIEHLEKCLGSKTDLLDDKLKFFNLICTIARDVGKLPRVYPSPPDSAKLIAKYLLEGDIETLWPLPSLPDLNINVELLVGELHSSLPGLPEEVSKPSLQNVSRDSTPIKHLLLSDSTEIFDSPKRRKLQSPAKSLSLNIQNKQAYKDLEKNELIQIDGRDKVMVNNVPYDQTLAEVNLSRDYISSLQQKVISVEAKLQKKEEIETELRQVNQEFQMRFFDIENSIKIIQPKFQEALNDLAQFEYQKEQALKQEKSTRCTLDLREAELDRVRKENTVLLNELKDARKALLNSEVPEISELERMRCELSTLSTDFELLHKQKETMDSDYEYLKSNYQTTSTSVKSLAQQIVCQKKEIEALKIKASENAVKIHQTQRDNTLSRLQFLIRGLRAEKSELERQVEKLSEQLQHSATTYSSGRPNTRGNSVPRSPRLGACLSPRPISRVMGDYNATSITSGNRSRGSSPSLALENNPGYRANAIAFAESPCGNSQPQRRVEKPSMKRFGTHLQ
ncbi:putative 60s ribosomal protein l4-a [Erysiphe neolycopersici]|uniref:Putative 60s ribosomal protein l4-a n=1 Tax=Erysiphe neolycopersici TaxID=212602 RepID=A0A420I1F9_9PEZI|nr:putative 60s ribosomal protein l4-a [Erysiphe neolycopersici]